MKDTGLVVASHGRHVMVERDSGERVLCHPKGKKNQALVGDRVRWSESGTDGSIDEVEPRRNVLYRQDEWRTKSFAANIDDLEIPEQLDCPNCGLPAGQDKENPPIIAKHEPYKTHLAYVKERRTDDEAKDLLEEAVNAVRERRVRLAEAAAAGE